MRIISWLFSVLVFAAPLAAQSINPSYQINWGGLVFFSQPGDTVTSIEAACTTTCTYVVTAPQTITLSGNHTLSSNVYLAFQSKGSWTVNGAFTLTIPSQVQGTISTHFQGSSSIKFGNNQSEVPVEWFGAVPDGSTDNTGALQDALDSLSSGQIVLQIGHYNHSGALTITRSNIGIKGYGMQVTNTTVINPNPPASILENTSANHDSVDVVGPGGGTFIGFNRFDNFNIKRSVAPTGTATGLSLSFTYGVQIDRVGVEDSIRGFYLQASGSQGIGYITNSAVTFGYNGFSETSGSVYGIYLDSSNGIQNPSFRIRHSFVAANGGVTATAYGLITTGSQLNDLMTYGFETAGVNYGEYVQQTSVGSVITSSDIHFFGTINDGCQTSCVFITGLTATAGGGVELNGGYNTTSGSNPMFDIESSYGVRVIGVQLGIAANANPGALIDVNNSSHVSLVGNEVEGVRNVGILLSNSTGVTVSANILHGNASVNGLIALTGSGLNYVGGNALDGTGASLIVDATSNGNAGLNTNTIAGTLTPALILGNNPIFNGSVSWSTGSGAPVGACANGSFYSNSATTVGTFATYACKSSAWVGQGTAY